MMAIMRLMLSDSSDDGQHATDAEQIRLMMVIMGPLLGRFV